MKNLNEMCDQVKKTKKNKNNKIYMPNDKENFNCKGKIRERYSC